MTFIYRIYFILVLFVFVGCQQKQEARKPVAYSSGSFIKQSTERNKQILKEQEAFFTSLIKKDTSKTYYSSQRGFSYFYNQKDTLKTPLPTKGDIVFFDYEIRDINNKLIYPIDECKNKVYRVEKENIISGLREGIKLLRKNDIATLYLPSQFGYGFHGDNKNIGSNTPLIIKVIVKDIKRITKPIVKKDTTLVAQQPIETSLLDKIVTTVQSAVTTTPEKKVTPPEKVVPPPIEKVIPKPVVILPKKKKIKPALVMPKPIIKEQLPEVKDNAFLKIKKQEPIISTKNDSTN